MNLKLEFDQIGEEIKQWDEYWIENAKSEFAEWVAVKMKEKNINKKELAKMIGTKKHNINKILKGRNLSLKTMVKISRGLGSFGISVVPIEMNKDNVWSLFTSLIEIY